MILGPMHVKSIFFDRFPSRQRFHSETFLKSQRMESVKGLVGVDKRKGQCMNQRSHCIFKQNTYHHFSKAIEIKKTIILRKCHL